jgi:hypothetical protein
VNTLGRAALAALLGLQALSPTPASAQDGPSPSGGTAVAVDGSVVTITVTIDLIIGGIGSTELPEGAQAAAGTLASDIETYWNQAFARYGTDCLELRLDVVINALPNSLPPPFIVNLGDGRPVAFVTKPGHHVVFWGEGNHGLNPPPPETYDPYDDDGIAPPGEDYGSPFDHELWAMWSPELGDMRGVAHEFGHLLGFGDDYDANGDPLPGREGTLMADGDFIDQNLVNRLADLVRDAGNALPECWKGTANITSSAVYPKGSATCKDGWELEFAFRVDSDGVIEGQGTAELTTPPTCSFPIDNIPSVTHAKYQVLGEETAGGFSLRFALAPWGFSSGATLAGFFSIFSVPASPSGGPPVAVGVSGVSGTGQGMWQFRSGNPPATYSATGTITLECVASCEPAS